MIQIPVFHYYRLWLFCIKWKGNRSDNGKSIYYSFVASIFIFFCDTLPLIQDTVAVNVEIKYKMPSKAYLVNLTDTIQGEKRARIKRNEIFEYTQVKACISMACFTGQTDVFTVLLHAVQCVSYKAFRCVASWLCVYLILRQLADNKCRTNSTKVFYNIRTFTFHFFIHATKRSCYLGH